MKSISILRIGITQIFDPDYNEMSDLTAIGEMDLRVLRDPVDRTHLKVAFRT